MTQDWVYQQRIEKQWEEDLEAYYQGFDNGIVEPLEPAESERQDEPTRRTPKINGLRSEPPTFS